MASRILFLIWAALLAESLSASCLKPLVIPPEESRCEKAEDCVVAGDSCRSCSPMAINKRFREANLKRDLAQRLKDHCVLTCEACSVSQHTLLCKQNMCVVSH